MGGSALAACVWPCLQSWLPQYFWTADGCSIKFLRARLMSPLGPKIFGRISEFTSFFFLALDPPSARQADGDLAWRLTLTPGTEIPTCSLSMATSNVDVRLPTFDGVYRASTVSHLHYGCRRRIEAGSNQPRSCRSSAWEPVDIFSRPEQDARA